jgi:hypothetical protein
MENSYNTACTPVGKFAPSSAGKVPVEVRQQENAMELRVKSEELRVKNVELKTIRN